MNAVPSSLHPVTADALDPQALERLRELDPAGRNRLLERVFEAFAVSITRLGPQLAQARGSGDLQGVRHVAHTLKSSSASIGALRLSQVCAEVESMVRESDSAGLPQRLDQLEAELATALAAVRQRQNSAR